MVGARLASSPGTSDLNGLPTLPSTDYNRQDIVLNSKDSASITAYSGFSAEPSRPSQSPSVGSLKSMCPPKNISAHPSTTQSILLFAVNRGFIIVLLFSRFSPLPRSLFVTRYILLPSSILAERGISVGKT